MKPTWVLATVLGLLAVAAVTVSAADEDALEIKFAECPAAVQKSLQAEAKGATIATVSKETEDGQTAYWASVPIGGKNYAIGVDEKGTLFALSLEVREGEVKFSDCPAPVQATLQRESKEAKLDVVGQDVRYGVRVYEVAVTVGDKNYALVVAEDGTLVEKTLVIAEDDVELANCPAAVRNALRDHSHGGTIGAVSRSSGIIGPVYEAEAEIHGKHYVLTVSESGMLIAKTLEEVD